MKYKVEVPMPLMQFLLEKTSQKRNDIKNLLKYQNVWVDGHIETHYAYDLQVGQTVEIQAKKNDMPFVILYEDKEIIVIDKPCGLLSEQTAKENEKTAYQYVKQYLYKKKENIFLVHRLDQYTSEIAIADPKGFTAIVDTAKKALAK